jgi:outer membrane lipopolysaccharide assembly protein LptE/RlpB
VDGCKFGSRQQDVSSQIKGRSRKKRIFPNNPAASNRKRLPKEHMTLVKRKQNEQYIPKQRVGSERRGESHRSCSRNTKNEPIKPLA